jgi:hypothetical protein
MSKPLRYCIRSVRYVHFTDTPIWGSIDRVHILNALARDWCIVDLGYTDEFNAENLHIKQHKYNKQSSKYLGFKAVGWRY